MRVIDNRGAIPTAFEEAAVRTTIQTAIWTPMARAVLMSA
jgi:hypothetical protein